MRFVLFNQTGIEVWLNDKHTVEVYDRGHFLVGEAIQWVEAANKVAEAFSYITWRGIKDIVNEHIEFDYSIPGEDQNFSHIESF